MFLQHILYSNTHSFHVLYILATISSILIYSLTTGQMITKPPVLTTAALGTNATFTCCGDGKVSWKINNTQANANDLVPLFAQQHIYVHLPIQGSSELIITATVDNNYTLSIQCNVAADSIRTEAVESDIVYLLVYGECTVAHNFNVVIFVPVINYNYCV